MRTNMPYTRAILYLKRNWHLLADYLKPKKPLLIETTKQPITYKYGKGFTCWCCSISKPESERGSQDVCKDCLNAPDTMTMTMTIR